MNKIYFFNAANFSFAQIDLRKRNIFFVGDNGSGKTTAIRAIHFYYNSDVKALGIDPNKESFKDFYFKYDNSFIVYDFEDYFVLMYKRNGDIKKIFSKQKFDLNRVLEDGEIVDLKRAIEYANEASLKYRPQTNEEYRKIIYGLLPQYSDFKLTTIKNYNTFINLYNKIFNVNKAVFDSKSIKEIIFTTLDRVEAGEIKYEEFLNELVEYRNYFIFYRKFREKEKDIEKLFNLKNELLKLKEEIESLLRKIAYKKEIEEKEIEELKENLATIEKEKNIVNRRFSRAYRRIKRIEEKVRKCIFDLELKIEEIKKLKSKFSFEKVKEAQKKVAFKEELTQKYVSLQTSLNDLVCGIKNHIEEIEEEINRLKREKRIIDEKKREEEIREKRSLEEIYFEKIEMLKEKFRDQEKLFLKEMEKIEEEIELNLKKKEKYLKEKEEVKQKYKKLEDELRELKEEEKRKLKNEIRKKKNEIEILIDENEKLKRKLDKKKNEYEEIVFEVKKEFEKNLRKNEERIKFYENILKTKEGSFKEFLNQNVENWEEELYPVIDESLLNMDVEELKPKVISDKIFGIELDKSKLKSIPTMKEAEEAIEKLNLINKSLFKELENKLEMLTKEFESVKIEIESKIEVNQEKIEAFKIEIKVLDEKIKEIEKSLENEIKKLQESMNEEIKLIEVNIKKINEIVKNLKTKKEEILKKIKSLKKEEKKEIEKLIEEKAREFERLKREIEKKAKKEKSLIDEKIKELNIKKNKISKNERIIELNKEIEKIKKELEDIEKEELFLREYMEKKDFIESYDRFLKELEKCKEFENKIEKMFLEFENKRSEKLKKLEDRKQNIENKIEIIKEGLKKVKNISLSNQKEKTNEFLSVLIDELKKKEGEFKDKRIDFKDIASSIKTAFERFLINGLEVNFNLEKLENLIPEEVEKVDELYLFKEKKFEVLNKTRIKGLKNLLGAIFEKKLDNFERSKEDFLEQVRRINKNLSKVDFGIVKNIKIEIEETNKNILKLFDKIKENIEDLLIMLEEDNLFFDRSESNKKLKKIEELFNIIKKEVKEESFSLIDVVDINVKFVENEKENTLKIIKNESSTGGSILLKIAIAVSLLELFLKEKAPFFLILDEVSVLSTKNQKLLKEFVNEKGLGVIYVTPDLPLIDVEDIDIYKFRNVKGEFEVIKLIADEGINIEN